LNRVEVSVIQTPTIASAEQTNAPAAANTPAGQTHSAAGQCSSLLALVDALDTFLRSAKQHPNRAVADHASPVEADKRIRTNGHALNADDLARPRKLQKFLDLRHNRLDWLFHIRLAPEKPDNVAHRKFPEIFQPTNFPAPPIN
jgi:hypothetical protein